MSKLSANNGKKQFPDGDFTKVNNAIIESYLTKLTHGQLRVLLVLAYRANNTTQIAQWTQKKIVERVGCSDRWVRQVVDELVAMRLIERVEKGYRLLPVPVETGTPVQAEPVENRNSSAAPPEVQCSTTGTAMQENRNSSAGLFNVFNQTHIQTQKNQTGLEAPNAQARPESPPAFIVDSLEDKADHLRRAIEECWDFTHGGQTPWSARAQQLVNKLVAEIPFTGEQWRQCVMNRFCSDGVNLGHLPEKFLALPRSSKWSIDSFLAGPLNRFGEPRDGINGYDPNLPAHSNRNRHTMEKLKLEYDKDGFDDDFGLLGPDKPVRRFN